MKHWIKRIVTAKPLRFIRRHWVVPTVVLTSCLIVFLLWTVYGPHTLAFSYSARTQCIGSPRLFPSSARAETTGTFDINRPVDFTIGNLAVYSSKVCATTVAPPPERTTITHHERLFGIALFSKQIVVVTSPYPKVTTRLEAARMVPPDMPLDLQLSSPDRVFSYRIATNEGETACTSVAQGLNCDVTPLNLAYAQEYTLKLVQAYEAQRQTVKTFTIKTITPISVTATSIPANSSIQDRPTQIIVTTDKKLVSTGITELVAKANGTETAIPVAVSLADNSLVVKLPAEPARKTAFELRIKNLRAADGSGLAGKTYNLPFTTSGGPKVKGVSIGSRNVGLNQSISINLDQVLHPGQDLTSHVKLLVNGAAFPASLAVSGDKITLKPAAAFPLCAKISLSTTASIQNQYGVTGDSAWSFAARATCYTTFSIGSSVRGRAITAYRFGTGERFIMYLGAMHGSEANSKQTMDEWIAELNRTPDRIPAGYSLVIIPSVNPDGVAVRSRFNARGVDLNRNFPANDWKSVVTTPQSSQPTAAGGPEPLSEPESQAIARYISQTAPALVLSFHSKAAVVEANEAGFSVSVAAQYASKARYQAVPKSQSADIFKYDTTGAMEDWLRDKLGRPAIVVELASGDLSEFGRNREALWYTTGL